jgi:hypothetical protein
MTTLEVVTLILAIGTFLMAGATVFMAFQGRRSAKATEELAKFSRETLEENRRLAESPRIKELIIQAINPVLEAIAEIKGCHQRREYMWIKPDLEMAKQILGSEQASNFQFGAENAFFPNPWLIIEEKASSFHGLNQPLYRDFGEMHPSLTGRIEQYDKKVEDFRHLLLELAKEINSPDFITVQFIKSLDRSLEVVPEGMSASGHFFTLQELALATACLAFNGLLGASEKFSHNQVRGTKFKNFWVKYGHSIAEKLSNSTNIKDKVEQITKEADHFIEELKIIEAELSQIKSGYQKDYHLTDDETEAKRLRGIEL